MGGRPLRRGAGAPPMGSPPKGPALQPGPPGAPHRPTPGGAVPRRRGARGKPFGEGGLEFTAYYWASRWWFPATAFKLRRTYFRANR